MKPCTWLRPRPVPLPTGLGGEEGLERARRTSRRHAGAGVGHRDSHIGARRQVPTCRRRATTFGVASSSLPPSGMASRALTTRFSSAASKRGSSIDRQRPGRGSSAIVELDRRRRPRAAAPHSKPVISAVDVCGFRLQRLLAREGQQLLGQRRAALDRAVASLSSSACASVAGGLRAQHSRPLDITVSRLLKSCAMPPVSWPIASIFCDWNSASRACSSALLRPCAVR